jgi:hypothetical protein
MCRAGLRAGGWLRGGCVGAVRHRGSSGTSTWQLHALEVEYAGGGAAAPARLLLKRSHGAAHHGLSTGKEVWFYTHLATDPAMAAFPLVPCYAAGHAPPYGASFALVADLSESHAQPPYSLPPLEAHGARAVAVLATLHATWWESPRLQEEIAPRLAWERGAAAAIGRLDPLEEVIPAFLAELGERLPPPGHDLYRRLLAALPRHEERLGAPPRTLLHGDPHWWNFLYPTPAAGGEDVRLLDWGSWRVGVATDDVAYALVLHLSPAQRRHLEPHLLKLYHRALVRGGVRAYDWPACWRDYRRSALWALLVPPRFWSIHVPAYIWWAQLQNGLAAVDELQSAELLEA